MLTWLFELNIGGEVIYASSFPVEFDGKLWIGGMDSLRFNEKLGIASGAPSQRQVTIDLIPPDDISLRVSYNHDVSVGTANLYLWDTDEPEYLAEQVFNRAIVNLPEAGANDELLSFTLSSEPYSDTSKIIKETMVLTEDTFPSTFPREGDIGKVYPFVYGTPGTYLSPTALGTKLVPPYSGLVIEETASGSGRANKILVSGHPINPDKVSTVTLAYKQSGSIIKYISGFTVLTAQDSFGQDYSYIDIAAQPIIVRDSEEFWILWEAGSEAHRNSDSKQYITTVGGYLEHLAYLSTVPIDTGSFKKLKDRLSFPIGIYIDDVDETPMDQILDIIQYLPVGLYNTQNGIAAIYIETEATGNPALTLIDGLDSFRDGGIRFTIDNEEIISEVTVKSAFNSVTSTYNEYVKVISDEYPSDEDLAIRRRLSTNSYSRAASVGVDKIQRSRIEEIDWIYEPITARFVASWLARYNCVSPQVVTVYVPQKKARSIYLGDEIIYTNTELNIDKVATTVTALEKSDSELWRIELTLFAGTVSDIMETGTGASSIPPRTNDGQP